MIPHFDSLQCTISSEGFLLFLWLISHSPILQDHPFLLFIQLLTCSLSLLNHAGYGYFVIIDHNIDYITLYGHLSEVFVAEGQVVGAGDVIGKVGSTGNSTGPHLHFEIRDFGRLIDPLILLMR
ncbi:M23 family metallopeptidase [Chloroflexi bacterium TSY]|nr:M23 family metallopeptidase [Chloroflexi bacterium TSY]